MDSQQQFCLKWNSFGSNLATAFSNLFKSESLADVTLFCEGVSFKAHKLILAACSKHLADLFETAPLHQNLLVILDGTSAANMSALLEFMYKGEVHVSQDALSSFLKAAECLQVKGLSIEHEKLAVAHSQHAHEAPLDSPTARKHSRLSTSSIKEECDTIHSMHHPAPSPSSYSPAMSPYMHPQHYRGYEQRLNSTGTGATYDSPRKRPLRSPSELQEAAAVRASVLRDGSKTAASRPGSPCTGPGGPLSLAYRPSSSSSSSLPPQPEADAPPEHKYEPDANATAATGTTFDRTTAVDSENTEQHQRRSIDDPGCPEGIKNSNLKITKSRMTKSLLNRDHQSRFDYLRMKMDSTNTPSEDHVTNSAGSNGAANGTVSSAATTTGYECDRDAPPPDIMSSNLWNSMPAKLSHKTGSVTTPDGKKLKCPFCERLYGYETNLRAHIRQRHQGIRVPCPFCSRTFTRNNTVRRHIAREHKAELSMKSFQQSHHAQQVHNHNQ